MIKKLKLFLLILLFIIIIKKNYSYETISPLKVSILKSINRIKSIKLYFYSSISKFYSKNSFQIIFPKEFLISYFEISASFKSYLSTSNIFDEKFEYNIVFSSILKRSIDNNNNNYFNNLDATNNQNLITFELIEDLYYESYLDKINQKLYILDIQFNEHDYQDYLDTSKILFINLIFDNKLTKHIHAVFNYNYNLEDNNIISTQLDTKIIINIDEVDNKTVNNNIILKKIQNLDINFTPNTTIFNLNKIELNFYNKVNIFSCFISSYINKKENNNLEYSSSTYNNQYTKFDNLDLNYIYDRSINKIVITNLNISLFKEMNYIISIKLEMLNFLSLENNKVDLFFYDSMNYLISKSYKHINIIKPEIEVNSEVYNYKDLESTPLFSNSLFPIKFNLKFKNIANKAKIKILYKNINNDFIFDINFIPSTCEISNLSTDLSNKPLCLPTFVFNKLDYKSFEIVLDINTNNLIYNKELDFDLLIYSFINNCNNLNNINSINFIIDLYYLNTSNFDYKNNDIEILIESKNTNMTAKCISVKEKSSFMINNYDYSDSIIYQEISTFDIVKKNNDYLKSINKVFIEENFINNFIADFEKSLTIDIKYLLDNKKDINNIIATSYKKDINVDDLVNFEIDHLDLVSNNNSTIGINSFYNNKENNQIKSCHISWGHFIENQSTEQINLIDDVNINNNRRFSVTLEDDNYEFNKVSIVGQKDYSFINKLNISNELEKELKGNLVIFSDCFFSKINIKSLYFNSYIDFFVNLYSKDLDYIRYNRLFKFNYPNYLKTIKNEDNYVIIKSYYSNFSNNNICLIHLDLKSSFIKNLNKNNFLQIIFENIELLNINDNYIDNKINNDLNMYPISSNPEYNINNLKSFVYYSAMPKSYINNINILSDNLSKTKKSNLKMYSAYELLNNSIIIGPLDDLDNLKYIKIPVLCSNNNNDDKNIILNFLPKKISNIKNNLHNIYTYKDKVINNNADKAIIVYEDMLYKSKNLYNYYNFSYVDNNVSFLYVNKNNYNIESCIILIKELKYYSNVNFYEDLINNNKKNYFKTINSESNNQYHKGFVNIYNFNAKSFVNKDILNNDPVNYNVFIQYNYNENNNKSIVFNFDKIYIDNNKYISINYKSSIFDFQCLGNIKDDNENKKLILLEFKQINHTNLSNKIPYDLRKIENSEYDSFNDVSLIIKSEINMSYSYIKQNLLNHSIKHKLFNTNKDITNNYNSSNEHNKSKQIELLFPNSKGFENCKVVDIFDKSFNNCFIDEVKNNKITCSYNNKYFLISPYIYLDCENKKTNIVFNEINYKSNYTNVLNVFSENKLLKNNQYSESKIISIYYNPYYSYYGNISVSFIFRSIITNNSILEFKINDINIEYFDIIKFACFPENLIEYCSIEKYETEENNKNNIKEKTTTSGEANDNFYNFNLLNINKNADIIQSKGISIYIKFKENTNISNEVVDRNIIIELNNIYLDYLKIESLKFNINYKLWDNINYFKDEISVTVKDRNNQPDYKKISFINSAIEYINNLSITLMYRGFIEIINIRLEFNRYNILAIELNNKFVNFFITNNIYNTIISINNVNLKNNINVVKLYYLNSSNVYIKLSKLNSLCIIDFITSSLVITDIAYIITDYNNINNYKNLFELQTSNSINLKEQKTYSLIKNNNSYICFTYNFSTKINQNLKRILIEFDSFYLSSNLNNISNVDINIQHIHNNNEIDNTSKELSIRLTIIKRLIIADILNNQNSNLNSNSNYNLNICIKLYNKSFYNIMITRILIIDNNNTNLASFVKTFDNNIIYDKNINKYYLSDNFINNKSKYYNCIKNINLFCNFSIYPINNNFLKLGRYSSFIFEKSYSTKYNTFLYSLDYIDNIILLNNIENVNINPNLFVFNYRINKYVVQLGISCLENLNYIELNFDNLNSKDNNINKDTNYLNFVRYPISISNIKATIDVSYYSLNFNNNIYNKIFFNLDEGYIYDKIQVIKSSKNNKRINSYYMNNLEDHLIVDKDLNDFKYNKIINIDNFSYISDLNYQISSTINNKYNNLNKCFLIEINKNILKKNIINNPNLNLYKDENKNNYVLTLHDYDTEDLVSCLNEDKLTFLLQDNYSKNSNLKNIFKFNKIKSFVLKKSINNVQSCLNLPQNQFNTNTEISMFTDKINVSNYYNIDNKSNNSLVCVNINNIILDSNQTKLFKHLCNNYFKDIDKYIICEDFSFNIEYNTSNYVKLNSSNNLYNEIKISKKTYTYIPYNKLKEDINKRYINSYSICIMKKNCLNCKQNYDNLKSYLESFVDYFSNNIKYKSILNNLYSNTNNNISISYNDLIYFSDKINIELEFDISKSYANINGFFEIHFKVNNINNYICYWKISNSHKDNIIDIEDCNDLSRCNNFIINSINLESNNFVIYPLSKNVKSFNYNQNYYFSIACKGNLPAANSFLYFKNAFIFKIINS